MDVNVALGDIEAHEVVLRLGRDSGGLACKGRMFCPILFLFITNVGFVLRAYERGEPLKVSSCASRSGCK